VVTLLRSVYLRRELLPFVPASAAWALGFSASQPTAPAGFFEAAAQVIPVLLLVLAIELRIFRFDPLLSREERAGAHPDKIVRSIQRRVYGIALLLALALGEVFALAHLMNGHGSPRPVLAAITAGLASVVVLALVEAPFATRDRRPPPT
jgi:hypothetical protein